MFVKLIHVNKYHRRLVMRNNSPFSPLPDPLLRAATSIHFCDCLCFLPHPRTIAISGCAHLKQDLTTAIGSFPTPW